MNRILMRAQLLTAFVLFFAIHIAHAAPYFPKSDDEVVEQLRTAPLSPEARATRALRTALQRTPNDLALAIRVAQSDIEQARTDADPRYLGYAQGVLIPWWKLPQPPNAVLLMRATIHQSNHDFPRALADLHVLLAHEPGNAQAWLTQAAILQAQADYTGAKHSCAALIRTSTTLAMACLANVASVNGQSAQANGLLDRVTAQAAGLTSAERRWILTTRAETAERLDDAQRADAYYREALAIDGGDNYLKGAYADFLLDQHRAPAVEVLLRKEIRADGLLLRLALAEQQLSRTELAAHIDALRARFAAGRLRGDRVHRREEARFTLELLHDPKTALSLAQKNWQVQREPADARVLLEAALAAHTPDAAGPALAWLASSHIEDRRLSAIAAKLKPASAAGSNGAAGDS